LILTLNLLCGISQAQSGFVSASLKFILSRVADASQLAPADRLSLLKFPRDYRTILNHFDLDPRLRFYVCCPSCCTLYDDVDFPDACTFCEFPSSSPCSVRLKQERVICGKPMIRPVAEVCIPGVEGMVGLDSILS